jgi:NDP-sugar pyrophosphorylase family protein
MKALLVCPSERPAVAGVRTSAPLAALQLLGQSLLEYWLSHLSTSGFREVLVLAHDRPEQIHAIAGDGARWGLAVKVEAESRELTTSQALLKYPFEVDSNIPEPGLALLDHFPGRAHLPLFDSYPGFFSALQDWLPRAVTPDRVGVREIRPGVWVSTDSRVCPGAQLRAPCWLGRHVWVGPEAVIGAGSIIEDGGIIETGAEVTSSYVLAGTFVGRLARLRDSIASGGTLVNWRTGSLTEVTDPFLLCALHHPRAVPPNGVLARVAELLARAKEETSLAWKHLALNKES